MDDIDTSRVAARLRVLLPLPLAGAYDYQAAPDDDCAPGDFVTVPLGRRQMIGVVWDRETATTDAVPDAKLRRIVARVDAPPLAPEMRHFIDWVSAYTLAPPGAVLRMAMSVPKAFEALRPVHAYRLSAAAPPADDKGLTPARRRVLAELANGTARSLAEIAQAAGVSDGVVRGLIERGWLDAVAVTPRDAAQPDWSRAGPTLSDDQREAAATVIAKLAQGFSVAVLDGVTGSGKTEVYFEAIAACLQRGKQALVLLPEIALSAQWFARFQARFGAPPAVWHSEVGEAQRRRTWRAVTESRVPVVVGARSALFLPFRDLGLIVIDEEHDGAFKQEDGVIYHARDMAVVRARFAQVPAILVSATPSLETTLNVQRGRYTALHLPDRHAGAVLPAIRTIDLRQDPPPRNTFLSPTLRQALKETLEAKEQALLFLNRRGYAPLTLCRTCGHRVECPSCTAWLVEHRGRGRLMCHHCGHSAPLPDACPSCRAAGSLVPCGPGVERVVEEVTALFPDARIALATSDTMEGPQAAAEFARRMEQREIDIVIGTQIIAKGHHFPSLTLVGVVDADLGLSGGDLRAAERTYQLLHQVAGRAGRGALPGRALLQTYMPEHPVMQALIRLSAGKDSRDRFLATEAEERRLHNWPPYGRLAAIIVSGPDDKLVERTARRLAATAPRSDGIEVLGPAPAPLARLRGRYRHRLLVKAKRESALQDALSHWIDNAQAPNSVRIQVDIDPYSFL